MPGRGPCTGLRGQTVQGPVVAPWLTGLAYKREIQDQKRDKRRERKESSPSLTQGVSCMILDGTLIKSLASCWLLVFTGIISSYSSSSPPRFIRKVPPLSTGMKIR